MTAKGRRDFRPNVIVSSKALPRVRTVLPLNPVVPLEMARRLLWLPDQARNMGIHIQAGKGSGKSRLMGRVIAWLDFIRGLPQVILDPTGATIDNFLDKFLYLPKADQERLWSRVRYCDMSGKHGVVTPLPFYYQFDTESLNDIASRFLDVVQRLDPHLTEAPILGWNSLATVGRRAGMILAALGYQITEMPSLLDYPELWERPLEYLVASCPEAQPAATFFLRYRHWKPQTRQQLTGSLRVKLDPFVLDPVMRAMFGADQPGINWPEVVEKRQTVLFDFRHDLNPESRRLKMLWAFRYFLEFIKHRGIGRHFPVGLLIDEITAFYNFDAQAGHTIFAADLDELINVIARNYNVWLTVAHQEAWQVDEKSRKTLMTMGTQILGATSDFDAALTLARDLFRINPHKVKRWQRVWMAGQFSGPFVVDANPVEYTVQEQEYQGASQFMDLGPFQFLVRPARREGDRTGKLFRLSFANLDGGLWNTAPLLNKLRPALSRRNGLPLAAVDAARDERRRLLTPPTPQPTTDSRGTLETDHEKSPAQLPTDSPASPPGDDDEATFRGDPAEMTRFSTVVFPPPKQPKTIAPIVQPDTSMFRLTQRDVDIVLSVFDYRALTTQHIDLLHFSASSRQANTTSSRCLHRLRLLTQAGFLARLEQEHTLSEGRKPYLYVITKAGVELVATHRDLAEAELAWAPLKKPSSLFLDHLLAGNSVRIAFSLAAQHNRWSIPLWYDEYTLKSAQMKDTVTITGPEGGTQQAAVIPDGYCVLATATYPYHFFLEIDRGTETAQAGKWGRKDWARKAQVYLNYYHSGQYQTRYQTTSLRILTVTTSDKRLATLKQATEKAGGKQRFWFTTQDRATTQDILTAPIWQKAGHTGTYALAC